MKSAALALLLALSGVEGLAYAETLRLPPPDKVPNIRKFTPGQRKFMFLTTVGGAAALAYAGSREGTGQAVAGGMGGIAVGFVGGAALIGIGAGLYYLWTGTPMAPFTYRFSLPGDAVLASR